MARVSRRRFVTGVLGCGVATAGYMWGIEPFRLQVTQRSIRFKQPLPRPVRLVQISDLHSSLVVPMMHIERAIGAALELKPDIVCLTGDYVSVHYGFEGERLTKALRRVADSTRTVAILGNHDGGSWAAERKGFPTTAEMSELVKGTGATLLHNDALVEQGISFVGLADLWTTEFDPRAAFARATAGKPTVLLSHNPDSKRALGEYQWDLMLCGHTHGGEVCIAGSTPFAPVRDHAYVAGLLPWRDRLIHVSTGVGSTTGGRFNCPPEVNLIELS
jgi:predicted MPP superfamily phosphohydrolase